MPIAVDLDWISSLKELFVQAIPQKYFQVLLLAMAFDMITGISLALKQRRFNSSIGMAGVLRKVSAIAGCTFVALLEYLLWQENILGKTVILLTVLYEATSVFENINAIDPRFGQLIQTVARQITRRLQSDADQKNDEPRRNRG